MNGHKKDWRLTSDEERELVMALNNHGQTTHIKANENGTFIRVKVQGSPRQAAVEAKKAVRPLFQEVSNISRWRDGALSWQGCKRAPTGGPRTISPSHTVRGVAVVRFYAG